MAALEGTGLVLQDPIDASRKVEFAFAAGALVITATPSLAEIRIAVGGSVVRMSPTEIVIEAASRVRIDGGGRVEMHADNALRLDAGGVGYTMFPDNWAYYVPFTGESYLPSPPEHPDSGGTHFYDPSDLNYQEALAEYLELFPDPPLP